MKVRGKYGSISLSTYDKDAPLIFIVGGVTMPKKGSVPPNFYPGDKLDINFTEQVNRLEKLKFNLRNIVDMFKSIDGEKSLQSQIWALDDFTRLFISCARFINASVEWQCDFAEIANLSNEQK